MTGDGEREGEEGWRVASWNIVELGFLESAESSSAFHLGGLTIFASKCAVMALNLLWLRRSRLCPGSLVAGRVLTQ
jgi:hypothetical protein